MTEEVAVQETQEEGTPQGHVPITEASDADLDAFLQAHSESEDKAADSPEPENDTQEEASAEVVESEEPVKEEPQEQKKEFIKPEELPEQPSKEDVDKIRRQIEHQRLFLARQTNEIGALRKQLREAKTELSKGIEDRYVENPAKAVQDTLKVNQIDQKLNELDAYEGQLTQQVQAQEILSHWVKPDEWDVEMMTEVLEKDGFPAEYLQSFRSNPIGAALPETLVQVAKRAKERRLLVALAQGYKAKEKEVADLQSKLKAQPKEVLSRINSVAKQTPGITSASGSGKNGSSKASLNPALMSNEQIEEFLKASN